MGALENSDPNTSTISIWKSLTYLMLWLSLISKRSSIKSFRIHYVIMRNTTTPSGRCCAQALPHSYSASRRTDRAAWNTLQCL
jgi:hypothetical protein